MRALSIAASGMQAQQMNVDVISHNIANMNTTGYKRQRAEFEDMLYQNVERPGATSSSNGTVLPMGIQLGAGVRADAVGRITEQGGMSQTGNAYDLAIDGRGYIQVTLPSGQTAYTRAGNLAVNADGQIVTADGYPIEAQLANTVEREKKWLKQWRYSRELLLPRLGQKREGPEAGQISLFWKRVSACKSLGALDRNTAAPATERPAGNSVHSEA